MGRLQGQGMCGTCHIKIVEGCFEKPDEFEKNTLAGLPNATTTSRLACQIYTDKKLNNMTFQILKDY